MLETIFYIPRDIAGVPVFGFGLLLAMWAVFSVGLFVWLVRRQGFSADTWSYLPLVLIMAAVIAWVVPALSDKEHGLPIHGYGVMILLAVVSGLGLAVWRARRVGVDPEMVLSLAFWMILPGIVGARVFYVAEYWSDQYWPIYRDATNGGVGPLVFAVVNVASGGLIVYGAFFGGVAGLLAFWHRYRIPLLATADLVAPSLLLGLALGRIGCLMHGCCFGGTCELPWAVTFPVDSPPYQSEASDPKLNIFYGVVMSDDPEAPPVVERVLRHSAADHAGLSAGDRIAGIDGEPAKTAGEAEKLLRRSFHEKKDIVVELTDGRTLTVAARSLPIHPTQLYAAITALVLCLVLLAYDPFVRRDGELTALMLTVYPIARFLEEMIRTDEQGIWGTGLHISQNISLAVLVFVIGMWIYILRQPVGRRFVVGRRNMSGS